MNDPRSKPELKERTFQFARRIVRMYGALRKSAEAQVLGKQVLRSGTSIGANYREAMRARSKAEFIAKLGDCLKEADETDYWLSLLAAENVLPAQRLVPLIEETNELIAILVASLNTARRGLKAEGRSQSAERKPDTRIEP